MIWGSQQATDALETFSFYMKESDFVLALIGVTVGVIIYLFDKTPFKWFIKLFETTNYDFTTWSIYLNRLSGFIWLGIFPAITMLVFGSQPVGFYGLFTLGPVNIWLIVLGLSFLILALNFFNSPREDNLEMYPQIRKLEWSYFLIGGSAFTWFLYLCSYEFLFRGILLFSSLAVLSQAASISLNICIYALVHIPKGLKETVASIPFGIILCLISINSSSVWPAIILHTVLALSNEWLSLYFHPKINIRRSQ